MTVNPFDLPGLKDRENQGRHNLPIQMIPVFLLSNH
jgi:hypothetical protein